MNQVSAELQGGSAYAATSAPRYFNPSKPLLSNAWNSQICVQWFCLFHRAHLKHMEYKTEEVHGQLWNIA